MFGAVLGKEITTVCRRRPNNTQQNSRSPILLGPASLSAHPPMMTSYPRAQRVARLIVNPQIPFGTTAVWTDTLINLHPLLGRPDTQIF